MINNISNFYLTKFIIQVLKGLGQIMLQENYLTGLFFIIGIFYGSFYMGIGALLATVISTFLASVLNFNKIDIDKGLYGFNSALIGVALILFLKPIFITWIFVIIASILSTIIQYIFLKYKLKTFTLTFVLIVWIFLVLIHNFLPNILNETSKTIDSHYNPYFFVIKGFGQVIFQDKIICGLIFIVAVFINSPISALFGIFGSLIGGLFAYCYSIQIITIGEGLFSFNSLLCALVFAKKEFRNFLYATISILISFVLSVILCKFNFIQLTFPFVAASIFVLTLKHYFENKKNIKLKF